MAKQSPEFAAAGAGGVVCEILCAFFLTPLPGMHLFGDFVLLLDAPGAFVRSCLGVVCVFAVCGFQMQ